MRDRSIHTLKTKLFNARRAAYGQRGLVTSQQLKTAGLDDLDVSLLKRAGELVWVLPFVWRFKRVLMNDPAKLLAAQYWLKDAAFSHKTAASLLGLDTRYAELELVRERKTRPQEGHLVRRGSTAENEVVLVGGARVTNVKRTLRDLAEQNEGDVLPIALESAWRKGLVAPADWLAELKRIPTAPRVLIRALRDCVRRKKQLESALEVRWWCSSKRAQLPMPELQLLLPDCFGELRRADFVYRGRRLIVETMGYEWHGTREAFEADAGRALALVAAGWTVIPVTWRMLEQNERLVTDAVRRALEVHPLRRGGQIVYDPAWHDYPGA